MENEEIITSEETPQKGNMQQNLRKLALNALYVILCVVLAYCLSNFLFTTVPVKGISMVPTLYHADNVLVYKPGKYKLGDVIVFNTHKTGPDGEIYYVKRIIGLPGDTIEVRRDEESGAYYVLRNGERLSEEYVNPDNLMVAEAPKVTVPEGSFYFMGDNRGSSGDSRLGEFGQLDSIVGRVVLRYQKIDGKLDWNTVKRNKK